ncbi:MAG: cupredoxin domain-containing protein [archaeon]|nr:cupredoxin domain-containing protein [archaeon]
MKFSIIALIAIISIVLVTGCTQQPPAGGASTGNEDETPTTGNGDLGPVETVEVSITTNGFEPSSIEINKGDTINFTNNDSQPHWPASNPHPIHSDVSGFDARQGLSQGESYSFTFNTAGNFGFHDHLNPSMTGTITITD